MAGEKSQLSGCFYFYIFLPSPFWFGLNIACSGKT
jgi:hypothetical protein